MGILGGSGPVQQNEFDLNHSWLQVSKRDRENQMTRWITGPTLMISSFHELPLW